MTIKRSGIVRDLLGRPSVPICFANGDGKQRVVNIYIHIYMHHMYRTRAKYVKTGHGHTTPHGDRSRHSKA